MYKVKRSSLDRIHISIVLSDFDENWSEHSSKPFLLSNFNIDSLGNQLKYRKRLTSFLAFHQLSAGIQFN